MRYIKYSKILILGLFSLTLSFIQCKKETGFKPNPIIKGQVTASGLPVDSATIKIWLVDLQSDTLTYIADSEGNYSTERINNWFDKDFFIEISRDYSTSSSRINHTQHYGPMPRYIGPDGLNSDSITSDAFYVNVDLKPAFSSYHFVTPKKLDFLYGQYNAYFFIINDLFGKLLEWKIGENNTEWMLIRNVRMIGWSDVNHLKVGGYVIHQVIINKLLPPGTYDSSFLIITDQGNTIIPVHVVVE